MKDSTAWFVNEAARSQVGALYEHEFARIASGQSRHLVCPASSVMPRVTTGNTMAPCVVIGERAADLIRKEHGL